VMNQQLAARQHALDGFSRILERRDACRPEFVGGRVACPRAAPLAGPGHEYASRVIPASSGADSSARSAMICASGQRPSAGAATGPPSAAPSARAAKTWGAEIQKLEATCESTSGIRVQALDPQGISMLIPIMTRLARAVSREPY